MQSTIEIRKARLTDLDAMKTIWVEFIDFHRDLEPVFQRTADAHETWGKFAEDRIVKDDWCVLVAEQNRRIVGHIMGTNTQRPPVFVDFRFGYIQDIAVAASHRRQGIGTALVDRITAWFKANDVSRLELDLVAANPVSQAFWRKMGFSSLMVRMQQVL